MIMQYEFTDVIQSFLISKECLENFIESLEIPDFEINVNDIKNIKKAELIADNELTNRVCVSNRWNINGFVIVGEKFEIVFLNPCYDYIRFWSIRNFFGYKLGQNHSWKNDGKKRYYINILPCETRIKNSFETYDIFNNYYIINIVSKSEQLDNWINALFQ